jgi:hypothetical protein
MPYTIDSFYKRWADDNVLIEFGERAACKGSVHECSSHEIALRKILEDERKDIKRNIIGIPHWFLFVRDWTGPSPVGVGSKSSIPFSTTNGLGQCGQDREEALIKMAICIVWFTSTIPRRPCFG